MRMSVILLTAIFLIGCNREAAQPPTPQVEEKTELKPVEPIECAKLLPLLPKPPMGYSAGTPLLESNDFDTRDDTFKYNFVEQTYKSRDRALTVRILDAAQIKYFYAWIDESASLKESSEEGSALGLKLDGNPAIERYRKADRRAELTVMLANRFQVEITATGVEPGFAREVYEKIDRQALAALKK
ncbi:MAG: hypothetical protein HYX68_19775 [Planctomycetes bacterium]|jgi:hypothetical protein|nr:hypothetical protein [Planctomycetota bacterium]